MAFIGALLALGATWLSDRLLTASASGDMVRVDGFSVFFHMIVAMVTALVILASFEYLERADASAWASTTG